MEPQKVAAAAAADAYYYCTWPTRRAKGVLSGECVQTSIETSRRVGMYTVCSSASDSASYGDNNGARERKRTRERERESEKSYSPHK